MPERGIQVPATVEREDEQLERPFVWTRFPFPDGTQRLEHAPFVGEDDAELVGEGRSWPPGVPHRVERPPKDLPGELVEVDKAGKIVRSIGGTDPAIRMGWTSGFAQLPNGNLMINDYTGRRLIEVDAKGKMVAQWRTGSRTIASVDVVK